MAAAEPEVVAVVARPERETHVALWMTFLRHRAGVFALALCAGSTWACASPQPRRFATPDAAMQALADLAGSGDMQQAEAIFTPDGVSLLASGDPADDREDALAVKALILQKVAFEDRDGSKIALIGNDGWPLAIPLAPHDGGWCFDIEAGREELLNRRIGRNELLALASLRACVDAQLEYFAQSHDSRPPAFARRFVSSAGLHDGLYWPAAEGQPESPIGPLLADADMEARIAGGGSAPFNGYFFRILDAQGAQAPGGARSYLDAAGLMTKGFAVVAWPAKPGNSGVMSFLVDRNGIIYEKDLGPDTATTVAAITAFDPDLTWTPTSD